MIVDENILNLYGELMAFRYRLGDDGSGELYEEDKFTLDHMLDFIDSLSRLEYVVYDSNEGSRELQIGEISYNENHEIVIRVHERREL